MNRLIYFFGQGCTEGDPNRKDILGGKGASLAAMSSAGLAVPPGFTLSVDCCRHFQENSGKWPEGLEEELRKNLFRLEEMTGRKFGQTGRPLLVSVRSGAAVSMPGMMDTLLNCGLHPGLADEMPNPDLFWHVYAQFIMQFGKTVAGIGDDVFESIQTDSSRERADLYRKLYEERAGKSFPDSPWDVLVACIEAVFESWNNERAITYRKAQDIRGVFGTAVNVQAMFPSEVSGIAFTANPANPLAHDIVIESSYGLGEAIVSGLVMPDLFVVDYKTRKLTSKTLGKKDQSFANIEKGAGETPHAADDFSLTDKQVDDLVVLALKVEEYFGYPVDIEWAIADGEFALLQSRAIRGLDVARDIEVGRLEEVERVRKLVDDTRKLWVVHNLSETLPAPTPLTWDIMRSFMTGSGGFGRMYQDFGYRSSDTVMTDGFLELICGRIYVDPERAAELFWGNMPLEYDLDSILEDPSIIEMAPTKFNASRADGTFLLRLPGLIRDMLASSRKMKRARTQAKTYFDEDILPAYLNYVSGKRAQDLTTLTTKRVIDELHEAIERVLGDFGKESLKPGFFGGLALADLEGILVQLMGEDEGRSLASTLTSGLEGDSTFEQSIMLHQVAQEQVSLDDFIGLYGHRTVNEMELAVPRWREDTSYLQNVLKTLRKRETISPQDRHEKNVEGRRAVEDVLIERLGEWGGSSMYEEVVDLAREAQALLPYRETSKHYLMMGYELLRNIIMDLSRRWELGRDVFFLKLDELRRFESERESLVGTIAQRKIRWQSAQRLAHPNLIDSESLDSVGVAPVVEEAQELDAQPLAPGIAQGTMRIIFNPNEADDLPTDCILVCPSTDPGWTALFTNIRGLVVERGGMLSHGAITARDFGIPAVACPDATRLLIHATHLRIDGNRGHVTIVDED